MMHGQGVPCMSRQGPCRWRTVWSRRCIREKTLPVLSGSGARAELRGCRFAKLRVLDGFATGVAFLGYLESENHPSLLLSPDRDSSQPQSSPQRWTGSMLGSVLSGACIRGKPGLRVTQDQAIQSHTERTSKRSKLTPMAPP
ncbi:hypothetical protein GSI_02222 [Ganoderma sinense ZZ0214-1]|uniref:Uncharacterized protein n=1 Tax=Ganoderma sinense ZZ0214-1 TaxID=1077348 RepID=A0A2G8SNZ7_9APHY|nr:hypothetical protein GSI_02222 [Ganoderma sinense ZZ0214-1]